MRSAFLVLLSLLAGACAEAPPGPAASPAGGPVVVAVLAAQANGPGGATAAADVHVPPDTAQARLELPGISEPPDALTAELEAASGEVRRWPVDGAAGGVSVTVPAYAVPAGEHELRLWRGDADLVARYRFRVLTP